MADNTTNLYSTPLNLNAAPTARSVTEYDRVISITERLFPGPVEVRSEADPEIPEYHCLVLSVVARGDLNDIMARDGQWHREVARQTSQSSNAYALMIDVQE